MAIPGIAERIDPRLVEAGVEWLGEPWRITEWLFTAGMAERGVVRLGASWQARRVK